MAATKFYSCFFMLFLTFILSLLSTETQFYFFNQSGLLVSGFGQRFRIMRRNNFRQSVPCRPISMWQKHGEICLYLPYSHQDITIAMDVEIQPGPHSEPDKPDKYSYMASYSKRSAVLGCLNTNLNLNNHYTKQKLLTLRSHIPVSTNVYQTLKDLRILKTRRSRAGKLVKSRSRSIPTILGRREFQNNYSHSELAYYQNVNKPKSTTTPLPPNTVCNNNLIHIKLQPHRQPVSTAKPLAFALFNAQSVRNKTLQVKDLIVDHDIDVLALTETWLSADDRDDMTIRDIYPTGYEFHSAPRGSRGGGLAFVYKNTLRLCKKSFVNTKFKSFEYSDMLMRHSATSLRLFTVYRPRPTKTNKSSIPLFFNEFSRFLERLATCSEPILLTGDFNFHVENSHDYTAQRFLQLLDYFNLKQHIWVPTHKSGHTLDLIITRSEDSVATSFDVFNPVLSDHYLVSCVLSIPKISFERKELAFRKLKTVNVSQLRTDIHNSSLLDGNHSTSDLNDLTAKYNTVLRDLLDRHAPVLKRHITVRPSAPWYNESINEQKRLRRKYERQWRESRLTVHRQMYQDQCLVVNRSIVKAKEDYYSRLIEDKSSNPKGLFSCVDKLLQRKPTLKLPHCDSNEKLANNFADFFHEKILKIHSGLEDRRSQSIPSPHCHDTPVCTAKFRKFQPISEHELSILIRRTPIKTCELDPLPAHLLSNCLDLLLPVISQIVNSSLAQGIVTSDMKEALLRPLLKKQSLDHEEYNNFRPISNLEFVSKVCERVAASQLQEHLTTNNLEEVFQSAYKTGHSTETALLRVHNDVLRAIDNNGCVIMLLLDMSAAFDTVSHDILLSRLKVRFGVEDTVYNWFASYLSGRVQFVKIGNSRSTSRRLNCGVPQGSVLGPLLYVLYTSPLGDIMRRHGVSYHLYADDNQLYMVFKSSIPGDAEQCQARVEACVRDIDHWMLLNNLKLNSDKTELLVLHSKSRPFPPIESVLVGEISVTPSSSARNIGTIFDSTMNLEKQVKAICKSGFYHLQNIAKIRKCLNFETTKKLVNAFVISRIDNCNALLAGLPDSLFLRLQSLQNAAARLIFLKRKSDHVTPLLFELHWLPIKLRIQFKTALLTYKSVNRLAPSYLSDLINIYSPLRSLRSSSQLLLEQPRYNMKSYGARAFSVYAPRLWNDLPLYLRQSSSVSCFKKNLKTFLFKQYYN